MFNDLVTDLLTTDLFPFNWDKDSYVFNRKEKDMHPYSIYNRDNEIIIVHNVLGIAKEDLKLHTETSKGTTYLIIEGSTKDSITGKEYTIQSKFALDTTQIELSSARSTLNNGLLYITFDKKIEKLEEPTFIEIL